MKKLLLLIAFVMMSASAMAQDVYYTKADYVFSLSKELLEKSIKIVADGDKVAFDKMIKDKQIYLFNANKEVYVVERSWGKVKIRLKGSTTEVWTVSEAISSKRN